MKKLLNCIALAFVLITLSAADGQVGSTSTATVQISITIPPRVDKVTIDPVTKQVVATGNTEWTTRVIMEDKKKNIKVVVFEPKL